MQRTYRTPKGTELPLLNLRGREYLEVKYRLVWFREDHPDWAIETELLSVTENSAFGRATIKDEKGRIIATSHKYEDKKGFPDFIEKVETGAIGRALALIGYGTQFCADELDEGPRIVDAPVDRSATRPQPVRASDGGEERRRPAAAQAAAPATVSAASGDEDPEMAGAAQNPKDPGDYLITFGKKYKGLKLRDIPRSELEGYLEWLEENATKKGLPLSEEARFLKVAVTRFLQGQEGSKAGGRQAAGSRSTAREGARH